MTIGRLIGRLDGVPTIVTTKEDARVTINLRLDINSITR